MSIDYQKLAEQTGSYLNDMGKKAVEIAIKGVVAESWAQFIPASIALVIGSIAALSIHRKFQSDSTNSKGEWKDYQWFWFCATMVVTAASAVWFLCSVHGVVMTHIAPEWTAIKAIAGYVRSR